MDVPEPSGLDPFALVILHLHRRFVILDDPGLEDLGHHERHDRLKQIGGDGHPVAHRRPGDLDPMAKQDAFLAIEWQVIGILIGNHVSHQPRAGEPLLDRLGKPLGDHDVGQRIRGRHISAARAGARSATQGRIRAVRGLPRRCDAARCRNRGTGVVRGGRRAGPACGAGSRAAAFGRGPSSWAGARLGGGGGSGTGSGCGVGLGLGLRQDFLGEEQELSGVDPLALPAVALAEELFELMLEFGVEMDLLAERLQQLADELMGRLEVVGEWVGRGDHTPYYVDVCSFVGANFSEFWRGVTGRV